MHTLSVVIRMQHDECVLEHLHAQPLCEDTQDRHFSEQQNSVSQDHEAGVFSSWYCTSASAPHQQPGEDPDNHRRRAEHGLFGGSRRATHPIKHHRVDVQRRCSYVACKRARQACSRFSVPWGVLK